MLEILLAYFRRSFPLTEESIAVIKEVVQSRHLQKGEFLQYKGEAAKFGTFVCKGLLRSYVTDDKGKEHIIQFAPENWWISDKSGITSGTASSFFIDAVEESDVFTVDLAGHNNLLEKVPGYSATFHAGIQKRSEAKDKRIVNSLTATAEERYDDFLITYPSIAQRVPQHMLASYLGVTPETLSRIRKQQSQKK